MDTFRQNSKENRDSFFSSNNQTKNLQEIQFKNNRPEVTAQLKTLNMANQAIQMKSYSVIRNLALKPHKVTKDTNDEGSKKKVRDKNLGFLRKGFPSTLPHDFVGDREAEDDYRGEEFRRRKAAMLHNVATHDSVEVPGAHVKGIKTHERGRSGTSQSKGVSALTGQQYIGAHLVKREWGGEDNMWNVVAWPQKAEDNWANQFEDPIDIHYAMERGGEINIGIHVRKEDEYISKTKATALDKINPKFLDEDDPSGKGKLLAENLVKLRYSINRSVESVPLIAQGTSNFGRATLDGGLTGYNIAKGAAEKVYEKEAQQAVEDVYGEKAKAINSKRIPHLKGGTGAEAKELKDRSRERAQAWKEETENYSPGFDHFNNVT